MKANISIVNKDEPNIVLTIADHILICRTFKNRLLNFRFSILHSFREKLHSYKDKSRFFASYTKSEI